jgi:hypothetical protein
MSREDIEGVWPYPEEDFMEIGETGWVPIGEGSYINKYTGNTIDEIGREYDASGSLIYDPEADMEM